MVLPDVLVAAAMDCIPSMLFTPGGPVVSLVVSIAGVAASVPVPEIGQMFGEAGLSVETVPEARLVVQ